jgi:hypothetical protein
LEIKVQMTWQEGVYMLKEAYQIKLKQVVEGSL